MHFNCSVTYPSYCSEAASVVDNADGRRPLGTKKEPTRLRKPHRESARVVAVNAAVVVLAFPALMIMHRSVLYCTLRYVEGKKLRAYIFFNTPHTKKCSTIESEESIS